MNLGRGGEGRGGEGRGGEGRGGEGRGGEGRGGEGRGGEGRGGEGRRRGRRWSEWREGEEKGQIKKKSSLNLKIDTPTCPPAHLAFLSPAKDGQ